ncbi:PREDICTED: protein TRM32-like isoform X2 [Nicotiana attenuata]|uniref:protein TRM32-like isoform X2 n=1 Tax=Nicotiana attenuata TaxID=49451 RepID=UPI0009046148|nr:PREDICTED: protein TRM32-like isoform X2 [Nicotiana attenuata]
MGKSLKHQDPSISPENPKGCMWGILHNLNHNRWQQVRKHLPHKRQSCGKQIAGDNATTTDSGDMQERVEGKLENSSIVAKTTAPGQVSKSSMLSRIRSLITEETTKKKGRHRRSSSCPIQLERINSIHHLDLAELQSSHEIPLVDNTLEKENYSVASLLDPPTKKTLEPIESENMRKDLSSLQLHSTQASKSRFDFIKSVSFPSCGSRGRRAVRSRNHKNKLECDYYAKGENESGFAEQLNSHSVTSTDLSSDDDDVGKHVQTRLESFNVSPRSPRAEKKHHESKLIINRFKNLRRKIRHALKESRKDRRIIMDAVLHKVPHGRGSSKKGNNTVEEKTTDRHVKYFPGSTCTHCSSPFSKSEMKYFRRTSSVNESLDRYNQLLDSCFYREGKQDGFDRSSFRASRSPSPARSSSPIGSLERILSMPDLRYYSSFKLEDSPEPGYSSYKLARAASSNNLSVGSTKSNEQKSLNIPLGSENQTEKGYYSDSKSTIFLDVNETFDDFGGLKTDENSSSVENIIGVTSSLNSKLDKSIPLPLPDIIFQNATSPARLSASKGAEEDTVTTDKKGISASEINKFHLQIQVDKRYKPEFNYVKDVLELSGFSGNDQFLGKWHSTDHPVNPSVFEELEICADMSCDQLLLFDLINEVLLQIYERSCSYWPKSLTCRSFIQTMPVGYHVLGEVWTDINSCLESEMKIDQPIDDAVSRDLAKDDTWMNLQFNAVCVGLELEDLILNDLIEELIFI